MFRPEPFTINLLTSYFPTDTRPQPFLLTSHISALLTPYCPHYPNLTPIPVLLEDFLDSSTFSHVVSQE